MQRLALNLKNHFSYRNFGKLAFDPFEKCKPPTDPQALKETV